MDAKLIKMMEEVMRDTTPIELEVISQYTKNFLELLVRISKTQILNSKQQLALVLSFSGVVIDGLGSDKLKEWAIDKLRENYDPREKRK